MFSEKKMEHSLKKGVFWKFLQTQPAQGFLYAWKMLEDDFSKRNSPTKMGDEKAKANWALKQTRVAHPIVLD